MNNKYAPKQLVAKPLSLGTQFGLLAFISPITLLRLSHRIPTVSPRRIGRLLGVLAASLGGAPLGGLERLAYGRRIQSQAIEKPPVFIIGHWRSGTTYLHNLLSCDPQFGCVRMFEAVAPHCSLSTRRWLPRVMQKIMPSKRPMDNMEWPMDAPQEEEIPLAKVTPYSWYLQFLFPQQAMETFERYVLLNGAPSSARQEVSDRLLRLSQIASIHEEGKRLLSKNPVHTARIPMLLELFPNARFVFLHRSPYEVYPSTKNMHRKILELTALQTYDEQTIERNVLSIYPAVMKRYLEDRAKIGVNRLTELSYSDLVSHPVQSIAQLYERLELPGFGVARKSISKYVATLGDYRKNLFPPLSARELGLINTHWDFAFSEWGYEPTPAV